MTPIDASSSTPSNDRNRLLSVATLARSAASVAAELGTLADEAISVALASGATEHDIAAMLGVTHETAQHLATGDLKFSRFLFECAREGTLPVATESARRKDLFNSRSIATNPRP